MNHDNGLARIHVLGLHILSLLYILGLQEEDSLYYSLARCMFYFPEEPEEKHAEYLKRLLYDELRKRSPKALHMGDVELSLAEMVCFIKERHLILWLPGVDGPSAFQVTNNIIEKSN